MPLGEVPPHFFNSLSGKDLIYCTIHESPPLWNRENSWYAIKFYTHSLCATEWHIGIFFGVYDMWGQWHTRNEYIF